MTLPVCVPLLAPCTVPPLLTLRACVPLLAAGGVAPPRYMHLVEANTAIASTCLAPGKCSTNYPGPTGLGATFNRRLLRHSFPYDIAALPHSHPSCLRYTTTCPWVYAARHCCSFCRTQLCKGPCGRPRASTWETRSEPSTIYAGTAPRVILHTASSVSTATAPTSTLHAIRTTAHDIVWSCSPIYAVLFSG